jgi:signal transduction histidine kinase
MTRPVDELPANRSAGTGSGDVDVLAEACSHQLGEAVTIVSGYIGVLREGGGASPATLRALEGGVDRVRRVTEDLLDLTRVAGRAFVPVRVVLADTVERAVDELGPDAGDLEVSAGPFVDVMGDPDQLSCALRQLLRAAAAARGPHQNRVHVAVATTPVDGDRTRLSVADDARPSRGLVGGVSRGRGPLVGAGAAALIVDRIAVAHGGVATRDHGDGFAVGFDLVVAS